MNIPDGLSSDEQLTYVIGAVTQGEAGLEYNSRLLQRALMREALFTPSYPDTDRNPEAHKATVRSNLRSLEAYADEEFYRVAVPLMHEALSLVDERNRIAHTLWLGPIDDAPGVFPPSLFMPELHIPEPELRTSIDEFAAVVDRIDEARRVMALITNLVDMTFMLRQFPERAERSQRLISSFYDIIYGDYDQSDSGVTPRGTHFARHFGAAAD